MKYLSTDGCEARRSRFNKAYLPVILSGEFDDKIDPRSAVWSCLSLLKEGLRTEANNLLRNVKLKHCHFMPMQLTEILCTYENMLDEDVKKRPRST